jgi:hypothetical protein
MKLDASAPVPVPKQKQVLVKVHSAGLNPVRAPLRAAARNLTSVSRRRGVPCAAARDLPDASRRHRWTTRRC